MKEGKEMYLNEDSYWNDVGIVVHNQENFDKVRNILNIFGVIDLASFFDNQIKEIDKLDFDKVNEAWISVAVDQGYSNNVLSAIVETDTTNYGKKPSNGYRSRYNFNEDEINEFKSQVYGLILEPYDNKFNKIDKNDLMTLNNIDDFNFKEYGL